MSRRFGHARVPGCTCTPSFTCGACLTETAHRAVAASFGVLAPPAPDAPPATIEGWPP